MGKAELPLAGRKEFLNLVPNVAWRSSPYTCRFDADDYAGTYADAFRVNRSGESDGIGGHHGNHHNAYPCACFRPVAVN